MVHAVGMLWALCAIAEAQEASLKSSTVKPGPFQGAASFVPWSGDYWRMSEGQLAIGWNGKKTFLYDKAQRQYIFNSKVAKNDRSPLAKYDLLVGNPISSGTAMRELTPAWDLGLFQEPTWMEHMLGRLTQFNWCHNVDPDLEKKLSQEKVEYDWWGHCNGWAAASILESEPFAPIEKKGIRFDVADLKGLLTESHFGVFATYAGKRYSAPSKKEIHHYKLAKKFLESFAKGSLGKYQAWYKGAYGAKAAPGSNVKAYRPSLEKYIKDFDQRYTQAVEDIRPDLFHKILTQIIGKQKRVAIFDVDAGEAVWNHPAYAYSGSIVDKGQRGVDQRVLGCTVTVQYVSDAVPPPAIGSYGFALKYTYDLYVGLNDSKLYGGRWTGKSVLDHPDFAWFPKYNPVGVDLGENKKLLYGKILEILPRKHLAEGRPFQLFANGIGSNSRRAKSSSLTWSMPVGVSGPVALSYQYQSSVHVPAKVRYYVQQVDDFWEKLEVRRAPLTPLGEGMPVVKNLSPGKHMIVAYAYDSSGRLLAIDEIAVAVK